MWPGRGSHHGHHHGRLSADIVLLEPRVNPSNFREFHRIVDSKERVMDEWNQSRIEKTVIVSRI